MLCSTETEESPQLGVPTIEVAEKNIKKYLASKRKTKYNDANAKEVERNLEGA